MTARRKQATRALPRIGRWQALALLLLACWAVRLQLVFRGGQLFFPDELRFDRTIQSIAAFELSGWQAGLLQLFSYPDHTLFPAVALAPAALAYVVDRHMGVEPGTGIVGLQLAAALLCVFSVACIALVYLLARRSGMTPGLSFAAAVLMALSTSMLYYAPHLLGYDASLSLLLLAALIGLNPRRTWRASVLCGGVAALGFLTYNGYWVAALLVMMVPLTLPRCTTRGLFQRMLAVSLGFVTPVLLLAAAIVAAHGEQFVFDVANFAQSVTMGDPREGWSLPFEYLWQLEHAVAVLWAAGAVLSVGITARRSSLGARYCATWVGLTIVGYTLLALTSSLLGVFVVAGRHVHQLVPFVCLAAVGGGSVLVRLHHVRVVSAALAAAIFAQYVVNVEPLFNLTYPSQFKAAANVPGAAEVWTVAGPPNSGDPTTARYVLVNVGVLWPVLGVHEPPAGETIMRAHHPLTFVPFRFEGYRPEERELLGRADLSMRLIQVPTQ